MSEADDQPKDLHPLVEALRREIATRTAEDERFIRLIVRDETKGFVVSETIKTERAADIRAQFEAAGIPVDPGSIKATAAAMRRLLFWAEVGGKFFKGIGMAFAGALGTYLVKKYGPEGWK